MHILSEICYCKSFRILYYDGVVCLSHLRSSRGHQTFVITANNSATFVLFIVTLSCRTFRNNKYTLTHPETTYIPRGILSHCVHSCTTHQTEVPRTPAGIHPQSGRS